MYDSDLMRRYAQQMEVEPVILKVQGFLTQNFAEPTA